MMAVDAEKTAREKERHRIVRLIEREAATWYSTDIKVWAALNGLAEMIESGKRRKVRVNNPVEVIGTTEPRPCYCEHWPANHPGHNGGACIFCGCLKYQAKPPTREEPPR